jgi:hypothetical protein
MALACLAGGDIYDVVSIDVKEMLQNDRQPSYFWND